MLNDEKLLMGAEPGRPVPYKNALASFIAADTLFGCAEDIIVVATGWLIFSKTKSTFALGMIGLAGFTPLILFSLLTGIATDRFDRRRVLAVSGAAFSIGALALSWAANLDAVWPIYLIVVFISSGKAFLGPVSNENRMSGTKPVRPIMPRAKVLFVLLKISQPVATTMMSSAQPNSVSAAMKLARAFLYGAAGLAAAPINSSLDMDCEGSVLRRPRSQGGN